MVAASPDKRIEAVDRRAKQAAKLRRITVGINCAQLTGKEGFQFDSL